MFEGLSSSKGGPKGGQNGRTLVNLEQCFIWLINPLEQRRLQTDVVCAPCVTYAA